MTTKPIKPKLVFFQYRYDERLPEFLLIHTRDHVRCLSEFFDVTVIHDDCDYQEICDQHEPDLALFESGVNHATCRRPKVTNIRACPGVPRVGLHNADAFCNARTGFLSDMDHLGIETFFEICTTAAEHTPEAADNIFSWPNCINPDIYRDYGAWKSIPVLFTGNTNALYPWRQKIVKLVSERYPSLICPHTGYDPGAAAAQVLFGERYARMINASVIAPSCGTVAKEVVRKHFEIPACRSCLVTERSAALEAAGFVDMENCVFADESSVLDKLRHLFQHPEELQDITERGYQLVHARHTFRQRDQILQWYRLHKNLQSHQAIVQTSAFGPLVAVDKSSGIKSAHVMSEGLHLGLLRKGNDLLQAGKYLDAENAYLKCMNYMRWMPEPKLRLALCKLHTGDARTAHTLIAEQIEFILGGYGAIDPDPVEWAYYTLSLLCLGKVEDAGLAARQFPRLRHPELDRARRVMNVVLGDQSDSAPLAAVRRRRTIHQLPDRAWNEWRDQVCLMLRACGQHGFAEQLKQSVEKPASETAAAGVGAAIATRQGILDESGPGSQSAEPGGAAAVRVFEQRFRKRPARLAFKRFVAQRLHGLEARYGYFLPYELSEMKRDEFFGELRKLAREHDVKRAILIGVGNAAGSTEALLAGIAETGVTPEVFCVDRSTSRFRRFERTFAGRVKTCGIRSSSPSEFSRNVDDTIKRIKEDHQIDAWDAVLVEGSVAADRNGIGVELQRDLRRARLVVLDGINNIGIHEHHERLLDDPDYVLAALNPGLRKGYAIHKRTSASGAAAAADHRIPAPSSRHASDALAPHPADAAPADGRLRATVPEILVAAKP